MAREVELRVKVTNRQEIDKTTDSMNRLKKASDDLNKSSTSAPSGELTQPEKLARWIASWNKDLPKAASGAKAAEDAISGVGKASEKLADSQSILDLFTSGVQKGMRAAGVEVTAAQARMVIAAGAIAVALVAAIAVVVAAVAVIYKLSEAIFHVAEAFARYALEIGKVSQDTGLALNTVSALRYEAEATGQEFGAVESAVNSFRKTVGQAAAGSKEATAQLKTLGLDGKKSINDIDGSFKSAISTIVKLPPGLDQARAAYAAFGEEGYKLIPFFQSFHGDVDGAIKRLQELGIMLSDKDVKAAKEFNRAYVDVQKQIQSLTNTFGREFLDTVTGVLRDVGVWVGRNKTTISDWATSTGNLVRGVVGAFGELVGFIEAHPTLIRVLLALGTFSASEGVIGTLKGLATAGGTTSTRPTPLSNYSRPQDKPPDLAALEAARAEQEKQAKEAIERNERDWDAAIEILKTKGADAVTALENTFKQVEDAFAASGNVDKFKKNTDALLAYYRNQVLPIIKQLGELEDTKATRKNFTPNEIAKLHQDEIKRATDFGQKEVDIRRKADELIKQSGQKAAAADYQTLQEQMRTRIELSDQVLQHALEDKQYEFEQGKATERDLLDFTGTVELEKLNIRKKYLEEFLIAADKTGKLTGEEQTRIFGQIASVINQTQKQQKDNARALTQEERQRLAVVNEIKRIEDDRRDPTAVGERQTAAANEEKLGLDREIDSLTDAIARRTAGINDDLIIQAELLRTILDIRNRELDAVITIQKAQIELSQKMVFSSNQIKAQVYDHLSQIRSLNDGIADGINKTFDSISGKLDDQIDKMFKWAGSFKSLFAEPLKALAGINLANFTTKILDAVFPGLGTKLQDATTNPIAKPITEKLTTTNKKLDDIIRLLGGHALGGAASGGLGSLISGINGGSLGGLGGGVFGGAGGGGGLLGSGGLLSRLLGSRTGTIDANGSYTVDGRSIWQKLTGAGGIFGPRENILTGSTSKMGGILGGIGDIASMIGGAIGGRVGGVISMAGMGASIGAMFGPWGAAIGAGAGALLGLFMGDPNKKKDKKENIPALRQGFTDAIKELQTILSDMRSLRIDPDEAISRASDVRNQIAGGFGVQFLSKKYRKQAQQEIAANLTRADSIIAEIKASAEIARGAADRSKRILPEFAGGYFADFFRPNGLIPGSFDARDNILAMISRGEMVINPRQQSMVRALAGFDVFAGAGIPNYPKPSTSPKLAVGGIAGTGLALASAPPQINFNPNFTLEVHGVHVEDTVDAYLVSDKGVRTQIQVQKRINTQKRSTS